MLVEIAQLHTAPLSGSFSAQLTRKTMSFLGRIARQGNFPVKYLTNYSKYYCTAPPVSQVIDKMVKKNKVVVFMKGNPEAPRCGFSNAVVQVMRMHGVPYDSYDVLSDETIRQGIKEFSNWPTIPQVFIDGEFVGGCDIMLQMHQNGELIEELKKVGIKSALLDKQPETEEKK